MGADIGDRVGGHRIPYLGIVDGHCGCCGSVRIIPLSGVGGMQQSRPDSHPAGELARFSSAVVLRRAEPHLFAPGP